MSKVELQSIDTVSTSGIIAAFNANETLIEEGFDNTLSRDGTSPNQMEADLDMNSKRIMNLPNAGTLTEPVRLKEFNEAVTSDVIGFSTADANKVFAGPASGVATTPTFRTLVANDVPEVYLNNTGLKVKDTNASHGLTIKPGSDLTADRVLTLNTGDAARTVTLSGDLTIGATSSLSGTAYAAGGTDVALADGGTGASTAQLATQNLRAAYVVGQSGAAVSHTGSTAETTLATIAIPANAIGPNGSVTVRFLTSQTNNANGKTLRVKYGTFAFATYGLASSATYHGEPGFWNANSASSQKAMTTLTGVFGTSTSAVVTSAQNSATALNITITGQLTNAADTIAVEAYTVIINYGA